MKKHDLIYAAGFIDGEGCITTSGMVGSFRLTISSTDKCILEWFEETFGGYINNQYVPKNPKHNIAWKWVITKQADLLVFLKVVLPHLKLKKSQAEVVIKHLKTYSFCHGKKPSPERQSDFKKAYDQLKYLKTVHV